MTTIPFDQTVRPEFRQTAQYILDLIRAGDPDTLVEDLALAAVDLLGHTSALRLVLSAALARLHEQDQQIDRLRQDKIDLIDQLRTCRAQRAA